MQAPRFLCTCPPTEECHLCTPSLWIWKPTNRIRRGALLTQLEIEQALYYVHSEPLLRQDTRSLLQKVEEVLTDDTDLSVKLDIEDELSTRAIEIHEEWLAEKSTTPLAKWAGEKYPDDAVAVVWWSDDLFDHVHNTHDYRNLLGQDCSTWKILSNQNFSQK